MIKNNEGCYECMAHCQESHISVPCNSGHCDYEHERMKEIPEPVVIGNNGIAYCPRCGADIHGKGMITECPNCGQSLTWKEKRRKIKDSTELSGGHLW